MEETIWSAHLSDDLIDLHGPISKSRLDRIGNALIKEQKSFRKNILQPGSRKLIERWEKMRMNQWKDLPEEQKERELMDYQLEREQLIEYGVMLEALTKHYGTLQEEYTKAIQQERRQPRICRCCLSSRE